MVAVVAGVVCVEEEEEAAVAVDEDGKTINNKRWLRCCRCGEVRRRREWRSHWRGRSDIASTPGIFDHQALSSCVRHAALEL